MEAEAGKKGQKSVCTLSRTPLHFESDSLLPLEVLPQSSKQSLATVCSFSSQWIFSL